MRENMQFVPLGPRLPQNKREEREWGKTCVRGFWEERKGQCWDVKGIN